MRKADQDELKSDRQTTAFSERLKGIFRSKAPTTPPVDPGMTYPKASDIKVTDRPAGPPPAPGASMEQIPSIPPTYGQPQQPGLFQPGNNINAIGANTIGMNDIPSIPPGADIPAVPPTISPVGGDHEPPVKHIPELRALMVESPPAETNSNTPQPSSEPELKFNAPLPGPAGQIAPGEPTGLASETSTPSKPQKDPFADLFPEDQKAPAATMTAANPAPATTTPTVTQAPKTQAPDDSPYTGRSLQAEPSGPEMKTVETLPPPPLEQLPQIPAVPPATAQPKEIKTAEIPPLELPPVAASTQTPAPAQSMAPSVPPELPKLEIPAPDQLPKLSTTPAPEIQINPVKTAAVTPTTTTPSAPTTPPPSNDQQSKMELIAARKDLKGLKGFCPVVLRDERNLVDASFLYTVSYNGREYALSSAEARDKFLADPVKYAPAAGGCDVIHLALTGEKLEGSLEHAVWYRGRLYLFSGVETMETFVAAPSSHATND